MWCRLSPAADVPSHTSGAAVGQHRKSTLFVKRHPELPPLRHEELPPPSRL